MHALISKFIAPGTWIHTDEFGNYDGLPEHYTHFVVNHLERYVEGNVHTNGIENFWSCLKRSFGGTYIAVEPCHLFRYVDEQAFRFNNRKDASGHKLSDSQRFSLALSQIAGKQLTFAEVTGKTQEAANATPEPSLILCVGSGAGSLRGRSFPPLLPLLLRGVESSLHFGMGDLQNFAQTLLEIPVLGGSWLCLH